MTHPSPDARPQIPREPRVDRRWQSPYHGGVNHGETPAMLGLRHLALFVARERFAATQRFYREGLGMAVDWEPDEDNVYLSSGRDNLALHASDEAPTGAAASGRGPLDHLGFMVPDLSALEAWHARLSKGASEWGIELLGHPRLHRDGASSFYLIDPAGHRVQLLHMPTIST
jgi:catechol 2,3-dioxygenase-like lactoylglutathione lyase family enzyme